MTASPPTHVLVTGGAGFIGSHLVERLVADGHAVTIFDDLSTGSRENLADAVAAAPDRVRLVVGDVRAPLAPQLPADEALGPIRRVVHLAAQVSVPRSVADPMGDRATNLDGAWHVLDLARALGAEKVVLASSAAVYGDVPLPASEDARPLPESPYGTHKLAAEHYARMASALFGVPTLNLRFFNVYGPRQSPQSGYAGVISIFIERAVRGDALTIFGDGEQTRDFIWVGDLVDTIATAIFSGPTDGSALNVGTGRTLSLNALAATIIAVTGSRSAVTHGPPRPGDIVHSCASVELLTAELGIRPSHDRADGLRRTAAWMLGGPASILR